MAKSHSYLDCIEASSLFREPRHLSQVHEQLATTDEAHDEENLMVRLKHVTHAHEERVISLKQDIFLELG